MHPALRGVLAAAALAASFFAGHALADQPRMQAALGHLIAARRELAAATADKGGHRGRAIAAVDEAIEQVRKGIAFDRQN
jgi:hypothetical protein